MVRFVEWFTAAAAAAAERREADAKRERFGLKLES